MRFPQEFIERVSEASNIVDIISQYTQLKSSGSGLMGRCPFPDHQEKTASFSVSDAKQVYHCFGCHKSGNIFTFLRDFQGMAFPDAMEYLARRANIDLPKLDQVSQEKFEKETDRKKTLLKANKLAHLFFFDQLKKQRDDSPVKKYLTKRGLTEDVIEAFQIGYAPPEWDGLVQHLQAKGVPMDIAEEARLVIPRKNGGNGHFDMFRDRLMFPILSTLTDALAFGGRIIEQGEPKYLNSPETPVFIKGRVLYGLHQTARFIRSEDVCLIVEGYMDLVALYQAGIQNAAATMGTALTTDHCRLIKRMTKNVVVLFDGDSAGMDAAERSLPILLAGEIYPKGLTLPDNMDPDDFVKARGSAALKTMIDQAPDLFSSILARWMEDYRGEASQKVKLMDKVKPVLEVIQDRRLQDLYLEEFAKHLSVSLTWLKQAMQFSKQEINQKLHQSVSSRGSQTASAPIKTDVEGRIILKNASKAELLLLNLALKSRANFDDVLSEQISSQVIHSGVKQILEKTEQIYRQDASRFDKLTSLFVTQVDQPDLLFLREAKAELASGEFDLESELKLLKDCYTKVRDDFFKAQTKSVMKETTSGPGSISEQEELNEKLKKIMDIQRTRIQNKKSPSKS